MTEQKNIICIECGKSFLPNVYNQVYCCKKCKDMARSRRQSLKNSNNLMIERTCIICGKKYFPNTGVQKTCSQECRKILKANAQKKHNQKNKKNYEPIKCKYCNEYFTPQKYNQIFCCKEHQEQYYKDNNYSSIKNKEYYQNNKEIIKKAHSEYYFTHKNKIIERGRKNDAKRQSTDIDYVIKKRIREQIRDHLKRNLFTKNFHTFDILGYTSQDLYERLEGLFSQNSSPHKEPISWDNMGTVWHIDHIRPCASFRFINKDGSLNVDAIKECWALENIQPMYSEDNMSKSSWYNGKFYQKGEVISEVDNA